MWCLDTVLLTVAVNVILSTGIVVLTILLCFSFRPENGLGRRFSYGDLVERSRLCHGIGQRNTVYAFHLIGLHDLVYVANVQSDPRRRKLGSHSARRVISVRLASTSHNSLV